MKFRMHKRYRFIVFKDSQYFMRKREKNLQLLHVQNNCQLQLKVAEPTLAPTCLCQSQMSIVGILFDAIIYTVPLVQFTKFAFVAYYQQLGNIHLTLLPTSNSFYLIPPTPSCSMDVTIKDGRNNTINAITVSNGTFLRLDTTTHGLSAAFISAYVHHFLIILFKITSVLKYQFL